MARKPKKTSEKKQAETPIDVPNSTRKPSTRPGLGRRHTYTEALGKAICTMLANGMTLTQICKRPGFPGRSTVISWALDGTHPFSEHYARARRLGYELMADQIIDVADDGSNDWMTIETRDGGSFEKVNKEAVDRSKLRVDARKWLLSKALPKVYGDKLDIKHDASTAFAKLWQRVGGGAPESSP